MTNESTFTSLTLLGTALSLSLVAATACGGSDEPDAVNRGAVSSASGGSGSVAEGTSTGATSSTGGNVSTGGRVSGGGTGSAESSSGGAGSADPGTGGSNTGGSDAGDTCEAGSGRQGDGADACPGLAWQCVDETVGNPPVHLMGAECSAEHGGSCCNYSDKCLTQTDGSADSLSAVEVALGPCQVGCIANPSAQACLDCINVSLNNAGLPALSNGCGTCWTSLISCSFTNCLTPCAAGSMSTACRECAFNQCLVGPGKFNECSGLLSNSGL